MLQITPEDKKLQEIILSEIPEKNYKNVLSISYGYDLISKVLPGQEVLSVDILTNANNQVQVDEDNKITFIHSSIFELHHKIQEKYELIVMIGVLYPHINKSYNLIYSILDQLLLDDGILVTCHIDEWYQARFPYLMLEYYLFEYREHTQRLEVYIK